MCILISSKNNIWFFKGSSCDVNQIRDNQEKFDHKLKDYVPSLIVRLPFCSHYIHETSKISFSFFPNIRIFDQ